MFIFANNLQAVCVIAENFENLEVSAAFLLEWLASRRRRALSGKYTMTRRTLGGALLGAVANRNMGAQTGRWLVYYSNQAPVHAFDPYSFLILDSRYHPPLAPLRKQGKRLIGYISLGEASEDYAYFGDLLAEGLLLKASATWKGNRYIDIRDRRWHARLCEKIVPAVLAKGFDGLFLDTLDSPLHMEQVEPAAFAGMAASAAQLIQELRRRYPRITIVLNRAYSLLDKVDSHIDVALGESVYSTFDFERKEYRLVAPETYRLQVRWLQEAARRRSGLRVFTLDYWNPADPAGIAKIYREERANGFAPYVTSVDLTNVVNEP